MAITVEVEIDMNGGIHTVHPDEKLPAGRAVLYWPDPEDIYPALMAEKSLEDWLSPEEDAAWAHLQPGK